MQHSHSRGCTWKMEREMRRWRVRGCPVLPQPPPGHLKATGLPVSPLPLRAGVWRLLLALTGTSAWDGAGAAVAFFVPRARPFLGLSATSLADLGGVSFLGPSATSSADLGGVSAALGRRFEARVVTWVDIRA